MSLGGRNNFTGINTFDQLYVRNLWVTENLTIYDADSDVSAFTSAKFGTADPQDFWLKSNNIPRFGITSAGWYLFTSSQASSVFNTSTFSDAFLGNGNPAPGWVRQTGAVSGIQVSAGTAFAMPQASGAIINTATPTTNTWSTTSAMTVQAKIVLMKATGTSVARHGVVAMQASSGPSGYGFYMQSPGGGGIPSVSLTKQSTSGSQGTVLGSIGLGSNPSAAGVVLKLIASSVGGTMTVSGFADGVFMLGIADSGTQYFAGNAGVTLSTTAGQDVSVSEFIDDFQVFSQTAPPFVTGDIVVQASASLWNMLGADTAIKHAQFFQDSLQLGFDAPVIFTGLTSAVISAGTSAFFPATTFGVVRLLSAVGTAGLSGVVGLSATGLTISAVGNDILISAAGSIGASASAAWMYPGTAAIPGIAFIGDNSTGLYRPSASTLSFSTAGVSGGQFAYVAGTSATDLFDRANENPITGWTTKLLTFRVIASAAHASGGGGTNSISYYAGFASSQDHIVQVDLLSATNLSATSEQGGPAARLASGAGISGVYFFRKTGAGPGWFLRSGLTVDLVTSAASNAASANHTVKLIVSGVSAIGFVDGVYLLSGTGLSSYSGYAGLYGSIASAGTASASYNNFSVNSSDASWAPAFTVYEGVSAILPSATFGVTRMLSAIGTTGLSGVVALSGVGVTISAVAANTILISAAAGNSPTGLWSFRNLAGGNLAGASASGNFFINADYFQTRNSTHNSFVGTTLAVSANITVGPSANGRDVAAGFPVDSWVYLYVISGTSAPAAIWSSAVPSVGPVLPTGYTSWAFAHANRFDATSSIVATRVRSGDVWYEINDGGANRVLANGLISALTTISLSAWQPPLAGGLIIMDWIAAGTAAASGIATIFSYRPTGSGLTGQVTLRVPGTVVGGGTQAVNRFYLVTNDSQQLDWQNNNISAGPGLYLDVMGYREPNGAW